MSVASLPPHSLGTYQDYMYIMPALYIINLIKFVKIKLCKYESFFSGSQHGVVKEYGICNQKLDQVFCVKFLT